jgi:hypothetical protein
VVRAPVDAPLQLMRFSRRSGLRWLWTSQNETEDRLQTREREAREAIDALAGSANHPAHRARIEAMRTHLRMHENASVDAADYEAREQQLVALRGRAQAYAGSIAAYNQRQDQANIAGAALHQDTLDAHAAIRLHGPNTARLDGLDALQQRHIALMNHVHQHNLDLPLPDRAHLAPAAYDQIQGDWRALTRTDNVISLVNGGTDGVRADLRSLHGRLLAGANGRQLLRNLVATSGTPDHNGQPLVLRIGTAPRDPATLAQRQARVGSRAARDVEEARLAALGADIGRRYDAASAEHKPGIAEEFTSTVSGPQMALQERYPSHLIEAQSPGSASSERQMTLREGVRDSEFLNTGTVADQAPRIPAPASVIYGHELVHVLRHRRPGAPEEVAPVAGGWGNTEEQATIEGVGAGVRVTPHGPVNINENALRDDYGIRRRRFHTSHSREEAGL